MPFRSNGSRLIEQITSDPGRRRAFEAMLAEDRYGDLERYCWTAERFFGRVDLRGKTVLEIGSGRVEVYPGNYEDFVWRKQGGATKLHEEISASIRQTEPDNGHVGAVPPTRPASEEAAPSNGKKPAKRLNPIKRKQMQGRAKELEEEISSLESAIAQCEASLQSFVNAEETTRLTRELGQNRAQLQQRISEWKQIGQELEP